MLVYLAWLAFLAILLAFILLWYRQTPRVDVERQVPGSVFQGAELPVTLRVRIRAPLPVRVVVTDTPPLTLVPDVLLEFGGLVWGDEQQVLHAKLRANRRGVLEWTGVTVRWADPFGLKWRTRHVPLPAQVEVYPGTHPLVLPNLLRPLLSEGALSRTLGLEDSLSLRGARPYVPGDAPQRVAWKLSARTGELMVRELERTASSSLQIHLDLAGDATFVESAARLSAALIGEARTMNLPVCVSTREDATPLGTSTEAFRLALRRLAQAQPDASRPAIPTPKLGSNLIVITQNAGDALVNAALHARAGASRVVIVALPEGYYLEPGEKGRRTRAAPPDQVRELARRAGILAESGVLVFVLRGDHSVLKLGV